LAANGRSAGHIFVLFGFAGERCKSDEVKEALRYSLTKRALSNLVINLLIIVLTRLFYDVVDLQIERSIQDGRAHVAPESCDFTFAGLDADPPQDRHEGHQVETQ
jgi:hypothetical protein